MDYGRMDMVNGNYMEENNRRMAEEEQRRKAEEERSVTKGVDATFPQCLVRYAQLFFTVQPLYFTRQGLVLEKKRHGSVQ